MKIDPTTHTVTLETASRPCHTCMGRGTQLKAMPCPTGGRGPRGGIGGCRTCHGMMRHYDPAVTETCHTCGGIDPKHAADESLYDTLNLDVVADLVAWRVVDATNTRFTEIGACIGARGSIVTTVDYGAHRSLTDDELVAAVRERNHSTQGVFVIREADMRLCDAVTIVRRSNGYNVIAAWDDTVAAAA